MIDIKKTGVRGLVAAVLLMVGTALLVASFPPFELWWAIWFAWVPLFLVLFSPRLNEWGAIVLSVLVGLLFFSGTMFWLKRFHPGAIAVAGLISTVPYLAAPLYLGRIMERRLPRLSLVAVPVLFVVFDHLRYLLPIPNPFGSIPYTQYPWLRLIQIVDLAGPAFITFLIVFGNMALYKIVVGSSRRNQFVVAPGAIWSAVAAAILVGGTLLYGSVRMDQLEADENRSFSVGLMQTSHVPTQPWNAHREEHLTAMEQMVDSFRSFPPDLLVFSEGAIDDAVTIDPEVRIDGNAELMNRLSGLTDGGSNVLIGALEKTSRAPDLFLNTAFFFDRNAELTGAYRKRLLVPFSEYYPFSDPVLPGLQEALLSVTNHVQFQAGPEQQPLLNVRARRGSETYTFGTLICFESTFPSLSREYARAGADFLVVMTNDYWSMTSSGPLQHYIYSVFRAIETRRPLVRVSNGGLSVYVDPLGRSYTNLAMFRPGTMGVDLTFVKDNPSTIYTRFGDWFVLLCAVSCLPLPAMVLVGGRRNRT